MKKKGFTLVELLAVIAILAILVIVAMPNVLGMFSEAKVNTFVTEVQKYMDTAKTTFMTEALKKPAQKITFASNGTGVELDMDGSKDYFIEMDRHGNFITVNIWDKSLCYVYKATVSGEVVTSTPMDKGDVTAAKIQNSDPDNDGNGTCAGTPAVN